MNMDDLYIFGASTNGELTYSLCKKHGIGVSGFLDNFTEKTVFLGAPVFRPEQADRLKPVVITSPVFAYDIKHQLDDLGFLNINLSQFNQLIGEEPDWSFDLNTKQNEYRLLKNRLADTKSRLVLEAAMRFRGTFDLYYTSSVKSDSLQWFDPEFFVPGPHVYIDGGAFNGDTAETFAEVCPGYDSMYLFEPSASLALTAKERFSPYRGVTVVNAGLSDKNEQSFLCNSGLPSGCLAATGEKIMLLRLDNYLVDAPTFIKLDVEGCEKAALLGAEQHIRKSKPMLAVAVYHRPQDIWEIPRVISGMRPDYKFYLRHYTQFYHETVLYAI